MTGPELQTFCTSLNGGMSIDVPTLNTLLNMGKAIFEGEKDWMALRKTDSSISVSSGGTWQTAYSISTITDFLKFYGKKPITIYNNNQAEYYRQVPFEKRVQYRDYDNTFVLDLRNKNVYFNGNLILAGNMYVNYIQDTPDVDVAIDTDIETNGSFPFPSRFHPILAFYAIGINKGAIDYDSISREMLPNNAAALVALKNAVSKWDNDLQLDSVDEYDPNLDTENSFRPNSIIIP